MRLTTVCSSLLVAIAIVVDEVEEQLLLAGNLVAGVGARIEDVVELTLRDGINRVHIAPPDLPVGIA